MFHPAAPQALFTPPGEPNKKGGKRCGAKQSATAWIAHGLFLYDVLTNNLAKRPCWPNKGTRTTLEMSDAAMAPPRFTAMKVSLNS